MPYSEMDPITLTKLALLSQRARKEPKCRFTSLAHLLDERFLKECYYQLGRDRASGIDGVSWKEYGEHLDENLNDLVARLKAKRYRPLPAKRVYIPKNEHEERLLGLPALEDKIVQKRIARILEAIYEQDFLDCSYGFRPRRSCHQALNVVDKIVMRQRINYVIEADIKGYFDNVSHAWVLKFLQVRIKDPSLLLLIRRFLKAGYLEAGQFVSAERGTPQGGNLSPMLANVFLHYVLDLWFAKVVAPRVQGACQLVRYVDDYICLIQHAEEAQRVIIALRQRFARFGLELHPEKTRVISFGRFERERASKENRRPNTFDFLGFTHYCGLNRKGKFILFRQTSRKKFRITCKEMNTWLRKIRNYRKTKEWWPVLCAKLRGHYQSYGVSGNMRSLDQFYNLVERMTLKWLNRRSQRQSFNWEAFRRYREHYPLPQPRIVHNFYTLSPAE